MPPLSTDRRLHLVVAAALLAAGCTGVVVDGEQASDSAELRVPGQVSVNGHIVDVEKTYLPRVVQCENPDAPYESLKAQAVAARTYLTYRSDGKSVPTIRDGQSDQVYTCANNQYGKYVAPLVLRAVQETRGEVVLHDGHITAGFFVAGSSRAADTCRGTTDPTDTESYVTYNFGLTDAESHLSSIGSRSDRANRGCMAQRLANCLADANSYDYNALLRYFYGSDAQVAEMGTPPPDDAQVMKLAGEDHLQVLCWSDTLGRPVPRGSCVQSASNRTWYQCTDDASFKPASVSGASGSGPLGACTATMPL